MSSGVGGGGGGCGYGCGAGRLEAADVPCHGRESHCRGHAALLAALPTGREARGRRAAAVDIAGGGGLMGLGQGRAGGRLGVVRRRGDRGATVVGGVGGRARGLGHARGRGHARGLGHAWGRGLGHARGSALEAALAVRVIQILFLMFEGEGVR